MTPFASCWRQAAAIGCLLVASIVPRSGAAQDLVIKRLFTAGTIEGCPRLVQPAAPAPAQRDEAERLTVQAQEAALVGNRTTARDLFRRAAQLDARDESVAYQLARTLDELGEREPALREYCRYLYLAPRASDAADVRARVAALRTVRTAARPDEAATQFTIGVEHFDRKRFGEAEAALSIAIRKDPAWAESYFNRAVVRAARRDEAGMVADLRRYLELAPAAPDRQAVSERLQVSNRQAILSPRVALTRGLVVPGMGQFYTRRPALGLLVMGGVGGALYYGLRPEYSIAVDTVFEGHVDPFGNPYTDTLEVRLRRAGRPNLGVGIAAASAVALAGAVEAWRYAKRSRPAATPPPVAGGSGSAVGAARAYPSTVPILLPSRTGLALGVRVDGL